MPDNREWHDASINCNAAGWKSEDQSYFKRQFFRMFEDNRRVPEANWFEVIGSLDREDSRAFRIGLGCSYKCRRAGDLFAFANDLADKYDNNQGALPLTISRIQ